MALHLLYIAACLAMGLSLPAGVLSGTGGLVVTIGLVGAWRYGWLAMNFSRAAYYIRSAYPRRKAKAEADYAALPHRAHAYFLTTTYRVEADVSTAVYRSVFEAAARSEGGATIVASLVDAGDERLVRTLFRRYEGLSPAVNLIIDRIPGTGKRDALANSLATISRQHPSSRDIVLLVDGDTCVPADIVARSAPFFTRSTVGALTTDERSDTRGSRLFRDWFDLRFTQRQMMMSAVALSRRVLTLTGRLSIFRADLAINPGFIAAVRSDSIEHWRFGRLEFLTGDDKSTWYWLLREGYEMVYLPDVQSVALETQPLPGFTQSAVTLMVRWFGNMLRTNGRALRLPPSRIGWFTWWSILDQRLSMWTTLTGPLAAILFAVFVDPLVLPAYFVWVMVTRYATCWVLAFFRGPFPITYPFLLYFSQIAGALTKTYVLFRLDRQRWTRQSNVGREARAGFFVNASGYLHALALGWFLIGLMALHGFLSSQ